MLNASAAVEVLRSLRPHAAVTTPAGTALVLVQLKDKVTVLEGGVVRVYERFEVEPVASSDDYTELERAWFRRPVKGAR